MLASYKGRSLIVKTLIECGSDVDAVDNAKDSSLHKAARYGDIECCRLLLEAGADINKKNNSSDTPLDSTIGAYSLRS